MRWYFTLLTILLYKLSSAQGFSVPAEIVKELQLKSIQVNKVEYSYKIKYPESYKAGSDTKVLLGLGGGDQSEKIVDYCYYTLFRSEYLKDHVVIMPITPVGQIINMQDSLSVNALLEALISNENLKSNNWIIAGTSFGGIACFSYADYRPELFEGIITFPGAPMDVFPEESNVRLIPNTPVMGTIPAEWKNYKIVLGIGESDVELWQTATENAIKMLKLSVKDISKFTLKDQEHIVSPSYNIDLVYHHYFN